MKYLRYGPVGHERPGLQYEDGNMGEQSQRVLAAAK